MADGPGGGGGGGNPNLNQWADVAKAVTSVERSTALIEQHMGAISKKGDDVSKIFKNAGTDLKVMVALSENVEEAIKNMREQSKKFQAAIAKTKTWEDQRAAVKAMAQGFKQMQKDFGHIPKMAAAAERGFEDCVKQLQEMVHKTGDMGSELIDAQKSVKGLVSEFDHLQKVVKGIEFGHMHRQIIGVSKALQAAGITKGKTAQYATQGAELAGKMRMLQSERLSENKSAYMAKRRAALADVEAKYGKDTADPARAEALRKAMGVSWLRRKSFAGAEAGGAGAQEAFGQHGTGMLGTIASRGAGLVESGIGGVGSAMAKAAPVLAILDLMRMAFDKTVEQNKDMEASLGKGGLFGAIPGRAGFLQARNNLTPGGMGVTALGLNFDRNLKMAQAITDSGMSIAELVTGKRGDRAGGEFMPGAIGQVQRIAVTAGRGMGLNDVEGVTQAMKMIQQFHMTIEGTEKFFHQTQKDLKASGISTQKWLGMLDQINSSFDRMNKNMLTAANLLREVSKYGGFSADALEDMLKLWTMGPKSSFSTTAPETFFAMQDPATRKRVQGAAFDTLGDTLDNSREALQKAGITNIPDLDAMKKMTATQAAQLFTEMQAKVNTATLKDMDKKSATEAISQLQQQASQAYALRGGALSYTTGMNITGDTQITQMGKMMERLNFLAKSTPGGMARLLSGDVSDPNIRMQLDAIATQVGGIQNFNEMRTRARGQMQTFGLSALQEDMQNEGSAKMMVSQLLKLPGFKEAFKTKKFFTDVSKNGKNNAEFIKENLTDLVYWAQNTGEVQDKMFKHVAKQPQIDEKQAKEDAMALGRSIGMQTQTTADVIANAFSKWFNDIVGFLGKLTMHFLKSEVDPTKTGPEFAKQMGRSGDAQEALGKKMDDLTAEMAGTKDPKRMAEIREEYDKTQKVLNDIRKYAESEDARNTASVKEAEKFTDEIQDALHDPKKTEAVKQDAEKLWRQISKVPGTSNYGVDTTITVPKDRISQMMAIPGVKDALASGALKQTAVGQELQITINNNYSASYDPGSQSPSAGATGSSGETTGAKKPTT